MVLLMQAAEADLFTFSGQAGEVVAITLADTGSAGGVFPLASVFSPTGAEVTSAFGPTQREITLPESGTYVIKVTANNLTGTVPYALGLECIVPPSPDAVALSCGSRVDGAIDAAAEADLFTFSGQAGEVVAITLADTGSAGGVFPPGLGLLAYWCGSDLGVWSDATGDYLAGEWDVCHQGYGQ